MKREYLLSVRFLIKTFYKNSVTIHLKHNYKQGKNKSDVTKITTSNQVKVCWNMRFLQFHTLTKHINSKCGALLSSLRKFS